MTIRDAFRNLSLKLGLRGPTPEPSPAEAPLPEPSAPPHTVGFSAPPEGAVLAPAMVDPEGNLGDAMQQAWYNLLFARRSRLQERLDTIEATEHECEIALGSFGGPPIRPRSTTLVAAAGIVAVASTFTFAFKSLLFDSLGLEPMQSLAVAFVCSVATAGLFAGVELWSARSDAESRTRGTGFALVNLLAAGSLLTLRMVSGGEGMLLWALGFSGLELAFVTALHLWGDRVKSAWRIYYQRERRYIALQAHLTSTRNMKARCQVALEANDVQLAQWRHHLRDVAARREQLNAAPLVPSLPVVDPHAPFNK